MTAQPNFAGFVEITRVAANDEPFLPTFCSPQDRSVRVLADVPGDMDVAEATRDWAAGLGSSEYYIAFPSADGVTVEHYESGRCKAAVAL